MPRDWDDLSTADSLIHVRSPDAVDGQTADLSIHREPPRGRDELALWIAGTRKIYADDPNFSIGDLQDVPVAGVTGFVFERTRTESLSPHHRRAVSPPPVKYREAIVSFRVGDEGYGVTFGGPVGLFEKHRPAFEHVLSTLKVSR